MVLTVTLLSLVLSYYIIITLKRELVLQNSIYIIYLAWHLPIILSIILPFSYFSIDESDKIRTLIFFLTAIHCIVLSGVFAYHKYKNKTYNRSIDKLAESQNKSKLNYYLFVYIPGAFLASIFWFLDTQSRGYELNLLSIQENRYNQLNLNSLGKLEASPLSFVAGFLGGLTFYLLYKSIDINYINNKAKIKINLWFLIPFTSYFLVTFFRGNKTILIPAILMLTFRLIYLFRPKLIRTTCILSVIFFIVLNIAVIQTTLRESSGFEYSSIGMKTKQDHPLKIITNYPSIYLSLGTLYLYYGLQYDMLSATIVTFDEPILPLGSLTGTVFYSRIKNVFDLPNWQDVNLYFSQKIQAKYKVFPGVWGTMFVGIYLEGGWIFILVVIFILSYFHFIAVKNYINKPREQQVLLLIILYCVIILGVQRSPIGHPTVISLIIFAFIKPSINGWMRFFFKPFIKKNTKLSKDCNIM